MEVILLEKLGRLGNIGDVVKVKDGYARNFLLPQSKALRATSANREVFEARKAEIEAENAKKRSEAVERSKKIEGAKIVIVRQASEDGRLYGSISPKDVADALKAAGYVLERKEVALINAIKTTGIHQARVDLHSDVSVEVSVAITTSSTDTFADVEKKSGKVSAKAPEAPVEADSSEAA